MMVSVAPVKFLTLAVLLMVSVLPVIPVAELSRPTLACAVSPSSVAEPVRASNSVEAKQYKRPDMNGDLRLGYFAGTKWKNLTGTTRWSDGTEMGTLDCSHLTSELWGVCKGGLPGPTGRGGSLAGAAGAEEQLV